MREEQRVVSHHAPEHGFMMLGGAFLMWLGLRQWSLPAIMLTAAGGVLVARGIAGDREIERDFDRALHDISPGHANAIIDEASDDSFPASDPPSWTATTGTGDAYQS